MGVLNADNTVNPTRIAWFPFNRLMELGEFLAKPAELPLVKECSPFVQCASISLGGGSDSCIELNCRLSRARALGRYAAAITDRVYVHNPFSAYLPTDDHQYFVEDSDDTRMQFFADLRVFLELAPLIEAGLVIPFPAEEHYCHYCVAESAFGEPARKRLDVALAEYKRRFRSVTRIAVSEAEHGFTIRLKAPETVLAHGGSLYDVDSLPRSLAKLPELRREIAAGREALVPTQVARRMRVSERYASDILRTLRYGLTTTAFGASYVTNAPAEIEILMGLSGDSEILNRNQLLARHLTSVIPFLDDVEPTALAALRKAEPESFVAYRKALASALSSVKSNPASKFTAADARAIYGDIIEPELTGLQKRVKEARRKAIRTAVRSAVGWGAALSFGLYSGIVPAELAGAVKALGLSKLFADAVSHTGAIKDAGDSAREESFYFLWRAKRLRSKR